MKEWNVVITVQEHHFAQACRFLDTLAHVSRTEFFNVVTMQVEDTEQFLQALQWQLQDDPAAAQCLARVVPVSNTFLFQSAEEFEERAKSVATEWLDRLAGKRFHVRMHRRGFKGRLSGQHEEQFLGHYLIDQLRERGMTAKIGFDDPDFIIAVETIAQRAGLSLWSRDELQRHPLVKLN